MLRGWKAVEDACGMARGRGGNDQCTPLTILTPSLPFAPFPAPHATSKDLASRARARESSHTARSGLSNRSATLTVFRRRTSIIDVPRLRLPLHAASPLNATDHQPCCPLLPCADPCALHTDITSSKSPPPKALLCPLGACKRA